MPDRDPEEEALLRRLNATAGGELPFEQLRRRYDALRDDYLGLLLRLEQVEAQAAERSPRPRMVDLLLEPLTLLRDEYASAAGAIQHVVDGLERLASATLRAQRPAAALADQPSDARVQVDVRGPEVGTMLHFREELEALPGVRRVTITAADHERATFLVDL
ncbi:MAG: hypothetical protein ACKVVT_18160 [Dehalococcoidia bacterium]